MVVIVSALCTKWDLVFLLCCLWQGIPANSTEHRFVLFFGPLWVPLLVKCSQYHLLCVLKLAWVFPLCWKILSVSPYVQSNCFWNCCLTSMLATVVSSFMATRAYPQLMKRDVGMPSFVARSVGVDNKQCKWVSIVGSSQLTFVSYQPFWWSWCIVHFYTCSIYNVNLVQWLITRWIFLVK